MAEQPRTPRRLIRSFEAKALKKRPLTAKIADSLTSTFGSLGFLLLNIVLFFAWIYINTGHVKLIYPFDPFPFVLLITLVSLEAIVLSIIVLMSQNRQGYISSLREELDLQVNLLSEREVSKALRLLIAIHKHLGIKKLDDAELEAMLRETDTSYIERKLEEQVKSEQPRTLPQVVAQPIVKVAESVGRTLTPPAEEKK